MKKSLTKHNRYNKKLAFLVAFHFDTPTHTHSRWSVWRDDLFAPPMASPIPLLSPFLSCIFSEKEADGVSRIAKKPGFNLLRWDGLGNVKVWGELELGVVWYSFTKNALIYERYFSIWLTEKLGCFYFWLLKVSGTLRSPMGCLSELFCTL